VTDPRTQTVCTSGVPSRFTDYRVRVKTNLPVFKFKDFSCRRRWWCSILLLAVHENEVFFPLCLQIQRVRMASRGDLEGRANSRARIAR